MSGLGGLPLVGAIAVIQGMPAFVSSARTVEETLNRLGNVAQNMSNVSSRAWQVAATTAEASAEIMIAAATTIEGAVEGAAAASIRAAASIEQKLAIVGALSQASASDLGDLNTALENIAETSNQSMSQAADAAVELAKAGLTVQQMLGGALDAVVNLTVASAGELGLDRAARLVATGLQAFSKSGVTAAQVADALTAAAQRSVLSFVDLQRSFQQAASVAAAAGLTVQDTAAALGVLGLAGIRGSDAGTALRQMLRALLSPSKEAQTILTQLGISLFDAAGNTRPFRDLLVDLSAKLGPTAVETGKVTEAYRLYALSTIFGSDAIRSAIVLTDKGTEAFDEMKNAMQQLTAADLAHKMLEPLSSQFKILQNDIGVTAVRFGTAFIPAVQLAVHWLQTLFKSVTPDSLALLGQVVGAFAGTNTFGSAFKTIGNVFDPAAATIIIGIITLLRNVGATVTEQVLPAVRTLWDTFRDLATPAGTLTNILILLENLSQGVRFVGNVIVVVLGVFNSLLTAINNNVTAADIFRAVLIGITAVPLLGIVLLFARLAVAVGGILVPLIAVGAALGLLGLIAARVDWTPIIDGAKRVGDAIRNNILTAFQVATVAAGVLATVLLLLAVAAIAPVILTLGGLAVSLAAVTVQAALTAAEIIFLAVSAIGSALIAASLATVGALAAMATGMIAAGTTAGALTLAIVAGILAALPGLVIALGSVAISLGVTSAEFAVVAGAALVAGAAIALNFVGQGVAAVITALPRLIIGLVLLGASFITIAAAATASAIQTAAAWVVTAVPAVLGAIGAIIAAVGPFLLGLAAIIAVIALVNKAWTENWGDIQGVVGKVLQWIGDRLGDFFEFLKSLPGFGDFIDGAVEKFNGLKDGIGSALGGAADNAGTYADQIGKIIEATTKSIPDSIKNFDDLNKQIEDSKTQAAADQAKLDELRASLAALGDNTEDTQGKTFAFNEEQRKAEAAARAYASAVEHLSDELISMGSESDKALREFGQKIDKIAEQTSTKINVATQDAADEITKTWDDAFKQIQDAQDSLSLSRANRQRKQDLSDELDEESRLRKNAREDEDADYQKGVDAARRARQQETQDAEQAFRDMQQAAERSFQAQAEAAEKAAQRAAQAQQDALKTIQDAQEKALSESFGKADTSRQRAQEDVDAQAQLARDLSRAKTQAEREQILQRFQDQQQDTSRRRSEQDADAAARAQEENALDALRKQHAQEQQALKNSQDDEDTKRKQNQQIAEDKFKRQQEKDFNDFKRKQDDAEQAARDREEVAARARTRIREVEDNKFKQQQRLQTQALDDKIEDEALAKRSADILTEAGARVDAINKALGEKREAILKDAAQEAADARSALDDRLADLRQRLVDETPRLLRDTNGAIAPVLAQTAAMFESQLGRVSDAADAAQKKLQAVLNYQTGGAKGNFPTFTIGGPAIPNQRFQDGGMVMGPWGSPQNVVAHAGEMILSIPAVAQMSMAMRQVSAALTSVNRAETNTPPRYMGGGGGQNTYHYEVNANYSRQQSEASMAMDLRAMIAMSRR